MSNSVIARIRSKVGWLLKRKRLGAYGENCHVGYNLILKNPQVISIGNNFSAGRDLILEVWSEYNSETFNANAGIVIGNDVSIMDNCQFSAAAGIRIGDGTLLGSNVFITDNFHGESDLNALEISPAKRNLYIKGKVEIGNNVWIGRNVCVMPNVTIGDGVVVGANSVVTKSIPAYCVAAGVPAKIIKECRNGD